MNAVPCAAILTILALAAADLPAQEATPWQFVHRAKFAGNAAFGADAIQRAVCADADALDQLAHAVHDRARAEQLAALVQEGYRRAGFPAATVAALDDHGALLLQVSEGARCKAGRLLLSGNQVVDTATLTAALAQKKGDWPGWPPKEVPACDEGTAAQAETIVRLCYADRARYGVELGCRFVPHDGAVDLEVAVRNEGRLVRVGRLELLGERPGDVDGVLERVHVAADEPLTPAVCQSVRDQLDALGRYTRIALPSMQDLAEGGEPRLAVRVLLAPFAPPVTATPWQDLAQVRAGIATFCDHLAAGKAFEVAFAVPAELSCAGCTLLPGPATVTIGAGGIALHCERLRHPDGSTTTADLVLGSAQSFVQLGDGHCGVVDYPETGATFSVMTIPAADGTMELRWGAGWATRGGSEVGVRVHPLTAMTLLQRNYARRSGDDIVVDLEQVAVRIDPRGQLRFDGAAAANALSCRLLDTRIGDVAAALRARFEGDKTLPMVAYLAGFAGERSAAMLAALSPAQRDALALLQSLRTFAWRQGAAATRTPSFELANRPTAARSDWLDFLAAAIAADLPTDSWATTLLLSHGDLARHVDGGIAARRVNAMALDASLGPLALGTSSALMASAGYRDAALLHRKVAAERWRADAAFADLRALATGGELHALLLALGAHWRGDPAVAAVFADLPRDADELAVVERAFTRCWDAGLGDLLRTVVFDDS